MRAWRIVAFAAGAGVLLVSVYISVFVAVPTSAERLRRIFELRDAASVDEMQSGIAAKFPSGTPETEIVAYLDAHRVGSDLYSSYDVEYGATIHCRMERRDYFDDVDYVVWFDLDAQHKLTRVRVARSFMVL